MMSQREIVIGVLIWPSLAYFVCCTDPGNPLYLTPLIESGKLENAKQMSRVQSPDFGCGTESYSGFLTVDKRYNSNLFFWFFKPRKQKAPLVLWLEGGPGATSMFGIFDEIGPFQIKNNLNIKCRTYSWTKAFSVIFIDSPVGTGFSFTQSDDGYATTLQNVTDNLHNALKQFFILFEDQKDNDFYLGGESYVGKYVPSLAYKIHIAKAGIANLKGIAIGNGFFDPISSLSYGPLLYQFGLIDDNQLLTFNEKEKEIQSLLTNEQYENGCKKWDALIFKQLYKGETIFEKATGYHYYYDVRYTKFPFDDSLIMLFFNKSEIRKALHVGSLPIVFGNEPNEPVVKAMFADVCRSVKPLMPVLMENYKVLLYNGNFDILLPGVIGNQFLKTLEWKYREEYLKANKSIWRVDSNDTEVAGYIKRVRRFREVIVRNAGHSATGDQPRATFDMITKFVSDSL